MISHAKMDFIEYQRLPELEPRALAGGLGDEHRLRIAEQVEVAVLREHPVELGEQLVEAGVGEDREPVVARGLAVLEPRRRADRAMLLERLVRRIGDRERHRPRRQALEPGHRVEGGERERGHRATLRAPSDNPFSYRSDTLETAR